METELIQGLPQWLIVFVFVSIIWSIPLKGVALWKAARLSQRRWFIILLIVNTFGILEIAYLYFVARKYTVEAVESK
jgi:hypothetical protein